MRALINRADLAPEPCRDIGGSVYGVTLPQYLVLVSGPSHPLQSRSFSSRFRHWMFPFGHWLQVAVSGARTEKREPLMRMDGHMT